MAGGLLESIFGGGGSAADDPYADILTPAQRNQMQVQGLLAMAGAFADAGMPSRLPIPFGSALGKAAAALGTGSEAGMTAAIANAFKAQQVRDLRAKAALQAKLNPIFQRILDQAQGTGGGSAASPGGAGVAPSLPGGGAGTETPPVAGGGGPSPTELSLPSDTNPDYFTRGMTAPGAGGGGGLLNYPAATEGMGVGGGGLLSQAPFNPNLQTETPSSRYLPGGDLYPFKDLGIVPSGAGGGATAPGAGAAVGPVDQSGQPAPPGYEYGRLPNGKLGIRAIDEGTPGDRAPTPVPEVTGVPGGTNGIDPRRRAALDAILGGMQSAQAGPSAQRLAQFAGPGAADAPASTGDAIPEGGGLLGVAPDLRGPIEANPFARQVSPGDPRGVAPLIRQAALRYGVDPDVALKVARSEGLGTFLGDQGKSGSAFQLYTGGGLGNEFQKQERLDPLDPANEPTAIDWALRNVNRTGWSPYHGAARVGIGPRTGLPGGDLPPPDEVIPSGSGAGGRPPVMQAQYRPQGGAAVPGMPQLAAPSSLPGLAAPSTLPPLAAPGAAPPLGAGGKIPGLNMTPQELAVIDAMAESAGLGNPFKGLLDTYYKSPGYLQESAGATARGRIAEEEPSQLRVQAAKARLDYIQKLSDNALTLDKDNNVVEIPGMRNLMGKTAGEIEAAKQQAQSQFALTDARVIGPDGQPTTTKMPIYEYIFRQQQGARNAAMGAKPQPGDIVSSPISGPPPEGFQYRMDPNGNLTAEPIPGTPAEQVVKDRVRKQAVADQATLVARDIMVQNTNRIEDLVQNSTLPVTGTTGPFLSRIGGTAANDVRVMIETMKARSSLDQLNQMRNSNPQGAGLGNVSNAEGDRLAAAIANLDQSQTKEQFLFNLRRTKEIYIDTVHGPGTYSKLSDEPVLKVPVMGATRPAPAIGTVQDGHSFKGGNPADPNNWQKVP